MAEKEGMMGHSLSREHPSRWIWPIDVLRYDRTPVLTEAERDALMCFTRTYQDRAAVVAKAEQQGQLARLIEPLRDALAVMESEERLKINTLHLYLRMCARDGRPFWVWEYELWLKVLSTSQADFFTMHKPGNSTDLRQLTVGVAYLLGCFRDFQALGGIEMALLASKVFGQQVVDATFAPILALHEQWGYSRKEIPTFRSVIAEALLLNGSPYAADLILAHLADVRMAMASIPRRHAMIYCLSRILAHLGSLPQPLPHLGALPPQSTSWSENAALHQSG